MTGIFIYCLISKVQQKYAIKLTSTKVVYSTSGGC